MMSCTCLWNSLLMTISYGHNLRSIPYGTGLSFYLAKVVVSCKMPTTLCFNCKPSNGALYFAWEELTYHDIDEQENCLQQFKLPEHVLCIGGYLQIELLGRVQRQHTDNLFYICVNHVRVLGRPLCPAFDIEILDPSGKFALKYNPMVFGWMLRSFSASVIRGRSG
ncbi:hypothetical protein RND71_015611 [Anisodus tanguticus]|uniref:Uncharacterized protein n=1 Tax=Anisodus tanguticus TaxID=243964 RepID=A0AAE1VBZ2_9SOLA|nr:hypothetical protein RND71_015611 [Anisodus tanguticus]